MNPGKLVFTVCLCALVFAYGLLVGVYQIFPYTSLKFVLNSIETVISERDNVFSNKPMGFLSENRYGGDGVITHDATSVMPGYTLMSGFFEDLPEIRLIKLDGSVIQRWPVAYFSLFADTDHILPKKDLPASNWNAAIHGLDILPDGAIVFNFDGKGTVKLDRCGNTVWTLARMTHHSINRSVDGSFWIPSRHFIEGEPVYPLFKSPYRDDTILHVSENGSVLSEHSVNEILINNQLYSLLVANGRFSVEMQEQDLLHVNDIEQLTPDDARGFEYFSAGDLLVSVRHLNLLLVIDPKTLQVKWHQTGPWLRQHDADFHANGTITVFNNNTDDTRSGKKFDGSHILSFQPFSPNQQTLNLYGGNKGERFFSNTQGKHQVLENGNILITEYYAGRVFEINSMREIVWEYINRYDDEYVAKISGAMRIPADYFTVDDWSCPAP